jgi:hypothetical protein
VFGCVSAILCLHPVIQKEWGSLLLTIKDLSDIDTVS